ncbi:glycosyltransferase family 4 protein [Myxococcota bacterium]
MTVYFMMFIVAASIAAALTPASRWISIRVGAMDVPDWRKVHLGPIPRLGGIAIVLAFLVPVAGLLVFPGVVGSKLEDSRLMIIALFGGGLVIAFLGALDDTRGLRARVKLVVQFAVAAAAWLAGFRFDRIGIPFAGVLDLPVWADFLLTVIWIAGVINAMNLIDGLDGLAAGVTFFVAATNLVLSIRSGNVIGAVFSATIAGAVIGFLLFNWNPAIVFMGDTGSMFLGYVLATTSIMTSQKVSTAVAMMIPILAMGVPVIDTLMSIIRRFLKKRSIFSADSGHLHHRLLRAGLTQRRAVLVIYGLCLVFAGVAIAMTAAKDIEAAVAMGVLAFVVIGIVRFFGFFSVTGALRSSLRKRQLSEKLKRQIPAFSAAAMDENILLDDLWKLLVDLCKGCGIKEISWHTVGIKPPDSRRERIKNYSIEEQKTITGTALLKYSTSSELDAGSYVELMIIFPASLGKIDEESSTLLSVVCDLIAARMKRIKESERWVSGIPQHAPSLPDPTEQDPTVNLEDENLSLAEHNPVLDVIWEQLVVSCRQIGYLSGVSWRSFGVKPADSREIMFANKDKASSRLLQRSVPITSLSFLEIRFFYSTKMGKRAAQDIVATVKKTCLQLGSQLRAAIK